MAKKTLEEIKRIEGEISLALQVLRNEMEILFIIQEHSKTSLPAEAETIIQEEVEESTHNIEELISLHKNLEEQIEKLENLLQDLLSKTP